MKRCVLIWKFPKFKMFYRKNRNQNGVLRGWCLEEQALTLVGKDVFEKLIKEYAKKGENSIVKVCLHSLVSVYQSV